MTRRFPCRLNVCTITVLMLVSCIVGEAKEKPNAKVAKLELPALPQPGAQAFVDMFLADYERLLADPSYIAEPSATVTWPSGLDQEQLYKNFGLGMTLPEEREKVRKLTRKTFRELGMDPDLAPETRYEDIRLSPVALSVKDGKLDGECDVWTRFKSAIDNTQSMNLGERSVVAKTAIRSILTSRGRYRFEGGELKSSMVLQMSDATTTIVYDDAAMNRMVEKTKLPPAAPSLTFIYTGSPEFKHISFMISDWPVVKAGLLKPSVKYKPQVITMIITDMDDGRQKMETYMGKRPQGIGYSKDGKLEGEQITYMEDFATKLKMRPDQMPGMEQARFVTINGERLIENRVFFKNGVQIKTAATGQ